MTLITRISKYFLNNFRRNIFDIKDCYIMTCDLEQKEWHELGNTGILLKRVNAYNDDNRQTRPTIGTIVYASEGAPLKVGMKAICRHFTFENSDGSRTNFSEDEELGKLFLVDNYNLCFGIDENDNLINREGVLLCKPIYGKFKDTTVELASDYEGRRRDIAQVVQVWNGCTEFKVGDYVMLKLGGDYEFKHNGETYLRVDAQNNDVYAISDSLDTYDSAMQKHAKFGVLAPNKINR